MKLIKMITTVEMLYAARMYKTNRE